MEIKIKYCFYKLIETARKNNCKVLVHCQAGISRSPTVVIAYLMNKYNMSMNEAYDRVRNKRPIIAPNIIFMSQLMDYESKILNNNNSSLKPCKTESQITTPAPQIQQQLTPQLLPVSSSPSLITQTSTSSNSSTSSTISNSSNSSSSTSSSMSLGPFSYSKNTYDDDMRMSPSDDFVKSNNESMNKTVVACN